MNCVEHVDASPETGLAGDRYQSANAKRQVTLIQAEHLSVLHQLLGREPIAPELLRRNIVVKGVNLLALKDKSFSIGPVVLGMTGLCHPCSRMEDLLGAGGYNAMRGHGGITAQVLVGGRMSVGDVVRAVEFDNKD
jgi:MOSC domain-containing protein YiiM